MGQMHHCQTKYLVRRTAYAAAPVPPPPAPSSPSP